MAEALHYLTLSEVGRRFRAGSLSPVALTEAMLARIAALDGRLHAYARLMRETALTEARQAEAELRQGRDRGPLHGVPLGIKDLCDTKGVATCAGMPILAGRVPERDATVVKRLRAAGAVLLGKLELTEGAYAAHHPRITAPVNPWHADYWTGVSSSGSGVATAAGLCFGSLGSDTGGSIRFPSLGCGVVGLKPTWGRVSRHGVLALADSLDHIGPMTRSVADAAAMLGVLAGHDPDDPTSLAAPVPDYVAALAEGARGLTIGFDERYCSEGVEPQVAAGVRAAAEVLRGAGATLTAITMPPDAAAVASWVPICGTEVAVAHDATFPAQADQYGPVLRGLIETGHALSATGYACAHFARLALAGALATLFRDVDLILAPPMAIPTPTLAELDALLARPRAVDYLIRYTAPYDLSGSPTLSLPCGFTAAGLPLGFQLIGRHLGEAALLRAGHAYERATAWHNRHPAV
ncbi:MAG: amidase [Alphaproteobacteria bacterium]|nr:amidase [Alphaproteobacteria bacterium]